MRADNPSIAGATRKGKHNHGQQYLFIVEKSGLEVLRNRFVIATTGPLTFDSVYLTWQKPVDKNSFQAENSAEPTYFSRPLATNPWHKPAAHTGGFFFFMCHSGADASTLLAYLPHH